ncbi:uncharacterized protein LOC135384767 [Ornithodoros turicata]|uniref:uncharacterized protein LOC135384767 n=1 Tax=Ornithodoros turicata TaxID=34597 RepID=UPI003139EAC9
MEGALAPARLVRTTVAAGTRHLRQSLRTRPPFAGTIGRSGYTLAASASAQSPCRLFYVLDLISRKRFLVDTGAQVSILPATSSEKRRPPTYHLVAVNNTGIPVFGERSLTLDIGLRRTFPWIFKVAATDQAIIGVDFLEHFGLLVDLRHHVLLDHGTKLRVAGIASSPTPQLATTTLAALQSPYAALLGEFRSLCLPPDWTKPVNHSVLHYIFPSGPPVHFKPRRLSPDQQKVARSEFEHMLAIGIVRTSSSDWETPLHMVP